MIIQMDKFLTLSKDSLCSVLKLNSLYVLEEDLLKALLKWCQINTAKSQKRMDQIVHDFLPLIRFPLIPYKRLVELNSKHRLLSIEQMENVFNYQEGKLYPYECKYTTQLRGCLTAVRFHLSDSNGPDKLICKSENVKRKFCVELRPTVPRLTLYAVSLMNGPYLVQVLVFDPSGCLMSYSRKDFSQWCETECCKETVLTLHEPVVCEPCENDMYKIEVHLSKSNSMFWYDNVIEHRYNGHEHLKVKNLNPEIISKFHYFV